MNINELIAPLALPLSLISLFLNRRQWRIINRPHVIVRLINPHAGSAGTPYELQVLNIGTRPAVEIRLKTDPTALQAALDPNSHSPADDVHACFSDATVIGSLLAGETTAAAFGYNGSGAGEQLWKMHSRLPIVITYKDLEGGAFKTMGSLVISTKNGFTGYMWGDQTKLQRPML